VKVLMRGLRHAPYPGHRPQSAHQCGGEPCETEDFCQRCSRPFWYSRLPACWPAPGSRAPQRPGHRDSPARAVSSTPEC